MNYEMILKNFQKGLWSEQMVHVAVIKGIITEQQYEDILENKPINYNSLIETINELNDVLDNASESMIQGVESIG